MATLTAKSLALGTARFAAQVAARRAAEPARRPVADGPAMRAALAAFEDHGRRVVQARRDRLAELGCAEPPARDTRLDLTLATPGARP